MRDESTMNHRIQPIIMWLLFSSLISHPSSLVRADGGAVRVREQAGAYQVTVFTSPTPFRAGPVDVSVLVQDAETGECVPEARVSVRLTARGTGGVLEYPATAEAATNKLFHAAVFRLPELGWWNVEVAVEGPHGPALLRFEVQADEPLPRWLELWPWFAWPALAVAFFGLHQVLVRRRILLSGRIGPQTAVWLGHPRDR
jgi:hypothetical protein